MASCACALLLFIMTSLSEAVTSQNEPRFTSKLFLQRDIDRILNKIDPPTTPFNLFKCWTCNNKTSNEDCNSWAPDVNCPLNHTVCSTTHQYMTSTGETIGISKSCALPSRCSAEHVGCKQLPEGITECRTCCDSMTCNIDVASSQSEAFAQSASVVSSGHRASLSNAACFMWLTVLVSVWSSLHMPSSNFIFGMTDR